MAGARAPDPTVEDARVLFLKDPPEKGDLALVFGHHDPEVSAFRARHAASLFQAKLVPRLLLSGGKGPRGERTEAQQMAAIARGLGVPEGALLLETRSRSTFENVSYSHSMLREAGLLDGVSAVLLVSCPWHMRRVFLVTRQTFPARVRLISTPHAECCTEETWQLSDRCRKAVSSEYHLVQRFIAEGLLRP